MNNSHINIDENIIVTRILEGVINMIGITSVSSGGISLDTKTKIDEMYEKICGQEEYEATTVPSGGKFSFILPFDPLAFRIIYPDHLSNGCGIYFDESYTSSNSSIFGLTNHVGNTFVFQSNQSWTCRIYAISK